MTQPGVAELGFSRRPPGSGAFILKFQERPHKKPDLEERGPAWRQYPNYYVEASDSPSPEMVPS